MTENGKLKSEKMTVSPVSMLIFVPRMLFQFQYPPFSKEVDTENKGT
jgi:hypothetical protein